MDFYIIKNSEFYLGKGWQEVKERIKNICMPWKSIFNKMGEGGNRSMMSGRWEFEENI